MFELFGNNSGTSPLNEYVQLYNGSYYRKSSETFHDKYNLLRNSSQVPFQVCNTFKYSPADWTLYELQKYEYTLENKTCNDLYRSLFRNEVLIYMKTEKRPQKRVKWIVHTDGSITSLGCTKHTHDCEPGSFYDYERQMRIDTPPCCRHKIMEILERVSNHLNEYNVSYMVVGGFVISYVRSKEILHSDEDVDMFIDTHHWQTDIFRNKMNELTKEFGYYQNWRMSDKKSMAVKYSKLNWNGLGMWDYTIDSKKIFRVVTHAPSYKADTMVPPFLVSMNNVVTKMPHKPEAYLDKTYGPGRWEHELDCKKKDRKKCA
uniref:Uncharacterized protein n=1 Tax=Clytia hemisphaerica TaxID=252671 RepID=A0A7M5XE93_9CNID